MNYWEGLSNAASGFVVSGGMVYVETGDLRLSLKAGGQGVLFGGGLGLITGGIGGYKYAKDNGLDLWSGVDADVLRYVKENGFYSGQKGSIDEKIMNKYLEQMYNEKFDATKGGAGYYYKEKIIFSDGHHRMNAAIKYYLSTGNDIYIKAIIKNGNFFYNNPSEYGYKIYPFIQK